MTEWTITILDKEAINQEDILKCFPGIVAISCISNNSFLVKSSYIDIQSLNRKWGHLVQSQVFRPYSIKGI